MKYFVTTGTSLENESRCWKLAEDQPRPDYVEDCDGQAIRSLNDQEQAMAVMKYQKSSAAGVLDALRAVNLEPPAPGYLEAARGVVRDYFDFACWNFQRRNTLPAELATILAMQYDNRPNVCPPDDVKFVFLAGQGNYAQAYLCAAILECAISRELSNATWRVSINPELFKWNPGNSSEFIKSMEGVENPTEPEDYSIRGRINAQNGDGYILTAGYKGVIISLAMQLKAARDASGIFYLHEDSHEVIRLSVDPVTGRLTSP